MEKDFIRMTGSSKKNAAYYERVFGQIEAGSCCIWNWSAALCSLYWMFFHKIYKEAFIITAAFIPICILLIALVPSQMFIDLVNTTFDRADLYFIVFCVVSYAVCFFIGGVFGNKMLFRSIKKKMEKGYSLERNYNPVDPGFLKIAIPYVLSVITQLTLFVTHCKLDSLTWLTYVTYSFAVIVLSLAFTFVYRLISVCFADFKGAKKFRKK
jgi:hypothetical protein